jgi:hypothetical protein
MTFDPSIHTRLLLKFDGTPGSTTLVDSGLDSCVVQANGGFNLSDTQVKFGPTSGFGEGNYNTPSWAVATLANPVGSSDFTIECFAFTGPGNPFNLNIGYGEGSVFALGGNGILALDIAYSLDGERNAAAIYADSYIAFFGDWYGGTLITDPTFIISNDWNHFAVTRSGNNLYFHTNGKLRGTYDVTGLNIADPRVVVSDYAASGGNYLFPGYVDELRVSSYPVYTESTYDVPVVEFSTVSLSVEIGVASSIDYELKAYAPALLSSCILAPPPPAPTLQPEEVIFTPVPPGIEYESLPVLDPVTQIIDTSPSQIIGCANAVPDGAEQSTLNALFPGAVDGDGVVNRQNNDIWKYDGTTWENVGPTPGPQVVVVSVLPPWNEIAIYDARIRTRLQVVALDYALALLTEPDPIGVVLGLDARRVKDRATPALTFTLAPFAPVYVGKRAIVIQPPTGSVALLAQTPLLGLDLEVIFSMDGPDGATSLTSIDSNAISATFNGNAQLDTTIKKYGTAALLLNGPATSDFIEYEAPVALGTDDFTVEFWAYVATGVTDYGTFAMISDLFAIEVDAGTGELYYYQDGGFGIVHEALFAKDAWSHVAAYRLNGTVYLALNGTVCLNPVVESHEFVTTTHRMGDWDGSGDYAIACHIDDYRLTVGTAVYGTGDFTPPAAPFEPSVN